MAIATGTESSTHYEDEKMAKENNESVSAHNQLPMDDYQPGSEAEKKLLRKLDMRIIVSSVEPTVTVGLLTSFEPCVWLLYLLGYLDRANIG